MHTGFHFIVAVAAIVSFATISSTNRLVGSNLKVLQKAFLQHTELKQWFVRLGERFEKMVDPDQEDIKEIRDGFYELKSYIYKYVTSSKFDMDVDSITESFINYLSPMIALLPSKEMTNLTNIVANDPDLKQFTDQVGVLLLY